jgi:hypothetical protein
MRRLRPVFVAGTRRWLPNRKSTGFPTSSPQGGHARVPEVVGEEKAMEADNGIGHRPRRASDSRCLWCYVAVVVFVSHRDGGHDQ